MQLNPILALELRARWRMNRSHVLLLGVALSLSILAAFVYQSASLQSLTTSSVISAPAATRSFGGDASSVGRQLFTTLAHANIFCWLLLAVASAATGIARERERGLLESLQLSRISAPGQVRARFFSNVLLLSVLQLVLLPVYAVAVMMGGVSAPEVGAVIYLATCSAVLGTSIGLWFSARSHRPTNALFGSLGVIALLSGGLFYWIQDTSVWASRSVIQWDTLWPMLLHPSGLFWALTDSTPKWSWSAPEMAVSAGAAWLVASLFLLWMAARNVNRTLPVATWQERARWVEKIKQKQAAAPKSARAQRTSNALLADLPLDRFVRFSDPLLAREVKARFRLRRAGFWLTLVRAALFIGAASTWLFEVFWLIDKPSRGEMAPYALHALLYGGTLCLAVLAATSWTRERESGTWESLKLSLLTPRQILRAKWLSPLISFAYYSAPLWILLPIGALYIDSLAFVAGVFVVAAWLGLAVALGLWMSWRVRNGTAAIAWTAGILAMLLFGLPQINNLVGIDDTLARWSIGVGNTREVYDVLYSGPGQTKPAVAASYEAATGNRALQPYTVNNGTTYYSYTPQFQTWSQEKGNDAEAFKARLHAWQPAEALDRLFAKPEPNYNNYGMRNSQLVDPLSAVLWSALLPLVITMLLLLLLRRDVRREQLNA